MRPMSLRRLIASLSHTHLQVCRPRPARPRPPFQPQIEVLESRTTPSVDVWTGANGNTDLNWSDPLNWSLGHAPLSTDIAQLTGNSLNPSVVNGNCTLDVSATIAGLQIDSSWGTTATLNGPLGNTLTLSSGSSNEWDSGTIGLLGGLVNNGTLSVNTNLPVFLGGTLDNNGTFNLNDTDPYTGLRLDPAGSLVNAGTLNLQTNDLISVGTGGGGSVSNSGTLEKTGGTGTAQIQAPFTTSGTIDVNSGTLAPTGGTTATGGTYDVGSGAELDLTGGSAGNATWNQSGTFAGSGAGAVVIDSGQLAIGSAGATFNIPTGMSFEWTGGTINIPSVTMVLNGTLTLNSASILGMPMSGGGTLQNNGTINQVGSASLDLTCTLDNTSTGTYDLQNDSGIYATGSGLFINAGLIEKTGGTNTSAITQSQPNMILENTGTLDAAIGTLAVNNSDNTGGSYEVAGGAKLDLTDDQAGGYFDESGTFNATGAGTILLDAGSLNIGGGATFNIPTGMAFDWTGGAINVAAGSSFNLLGSMQITGNGTEYVTGAGTMYIGSSSQTGVLNDTSTSNTLNIASGSTLAINKKGTLNIADDTINGSGLLQNFGALVKTAGTSGATIATTVDNQGRIQVSNGTLTLSGAVDQVFDNTLTGGTWTVASTATTASTLDITSASFTSIGTSARVTLTGIDSTFSNLSSLSTIDRGGTLTLSGGASLTTTPASGTFTNNGTLTLTPSATADSVLTVDGAFTQTPTGTLSIGLSGTASAPTSGAINSTGAVTLAGTLKVTSSVKVPAVNSSLELLDNTSGSPISGTFAGLPEGATFTVDGMTFQITYAGGNGQSVVITRKS